MQTRLPRCRLAIAILLLLALSPGGALALTVDVTRLDNDLLQIVVDDIDQIEGRVYTLDRASGEIVFGDGLQGTRPPSGRTGILGAYRFGEGASVFREFDLLDADFPFPIAVAALLDPQQEKDDINFVLVGIGALKFELNATDLTVLSAEFSAVPLPGTFGLWLSALAVLGLLGRRKFVN